MDSFNARTVMAARIARECPAAMRPPGEPVAAAPGPVAAASRGLGPTAGYKGWDAVAAALPGSSVWRPLSS